MATKNKLFYLDSGYSKHLIGDASLLSSFSEKHGGFVTHGDNKSKILGSGNIGDKDTLIIKDVLLVEELKHNFLSIS